MNLIIIYSTVQLLFAIILIWITTSIIIKKKKIALFMPFFIAGITSCFYSGFLYNELFVNVAWLFIEILLIIAVAWILIIVRGSKW